MQSFPLRNAASNASDAPAAIAMAPPVARVVDRTRRVPYRHARELGAGKHVGAAVLHALELPDRPPELHALLRVVGRRLDTPLREPEGLGREQHRGDVAHTFARDRAEPPFVRHGGCAGVDLHACDATRLVDALQFGDAQVRRVERDPLPVHLAHDHVGQLSSEHRFAPGERDRAGARARRQIGQ